MGRVIRLTILGIRVTLPWVIRAIGFTIRLSLIAVASMWVGVPNACRNIANMYVMRAEKAGFSTLYSAHLYNAICIVAFFAILLCWVVFSFITVIIVSLIL